MTRPTIVVAPGGVNDPRTQLSIDAAATQLRREIDQEVQVRIESAGLRPLHGWTTRTASVRGEHDLIDTEDERALLTAVQARERWDQLAPSAHVFHFPGEADVLRVFDAYRLHALRDGTAMLVAPFDIFELQNDDAIWRPTSIASGAEGMVRSSEVRPDGWLVDARQPTWLVFDRYRTRFVLNPVHYERRMIASGIDATIANLVAERALREKSVVFETYGGPGLLDVRTGAIHQDAPSTRPLCVPGCDHSEHWDDSAWMTGTRLVRAFAWFINHADVSAQQYADPERPPNRQQRRAAGYIERPHWRIAIRGRFERVVAELAEGRNVRERRPHDVRGHLRHLSSGRVTPVRPHRRCRESTKPFFPRDYEVVPRPEVSAC